MSSHFINLMIGVLVFYSLLKQVMKIGTQQTPKLANSLMLSSLNKPKKAIVKELLICLKTTTIHPTKLILLNKLRQSRSGRSSQIITKLR